MLLPARATEQTILYQQDIGSLTLIQGNSLIGLYGWQKTEIGLVRVNNRELIKCLIRYESAGNQDAIGKHGERGVLQFLPTTFLSFSKRYGLDLDIANPEHQIILANRMLKENPENISHWTTAKYCL